jgi:hypothetical protein
VKLTEVMRHGNGNWLSNMTVAEASKVWTMAKARGRLAIIPLFTTIYALSSVKEADVFFLTTAINPDSIIGFREVEIG